MYLYIYYFDFTLLGCVHIFLKNYFFFRRQSCCFVLTRSYLVLNDVILMASNSKVNLPVLNKVVVAQCQWVLCNSILYSPFGKAFYGNEQLQDKLDVCDENFHLILIKQQCIIAISTWNTVNSYWVDTHVGQLLFSEVILSRQLHKSYPYFLG